MARRTPEDIRRVLESLIRLLPGAVAHDLLQEAKRGEFGENERVDLLRASLMSYLSARRPDKMRRAFTKPLEPYLVDDDWLVLSAHDVPGLISRLDAGALWATASAQSIGSQAADRLSRLAAQAATEGFIEANESMVVAETASFVARQINHAAADKASLYQWLQFFNTARAAAADVAGAFDVGLLRPRASEWLVWIAEVLNGGETLSRHFVNLRRQLGANYEGQGTARSVGLIFAVRAALDMDLAREGLRTNLADMVPAVALNLSLNYGVIGEFIRQAGDRADAATAMSALNAHVMALVGAIDRTFDVKGTEMQREIFLDLLEMAVSAVKRAGMTDEVATGALGRLVVRSRINPALRNVAKRLQSLA